MNVGDDVVDLSVGALFKHFHPISIDALGHYDSRLAHERRAETKIRDKRLCREKPNV
jgi:hypothetical protein